MIEPVEKSTEVPTDTEVPVLKPVFEEVAENVVLDSRLGIFHREEGWLAVADLHFGYEVSRRAAGGLWPMWGMEAITQRLREMVHAWNPDRIILVGDIVDSAAAPKEALAWLGTLDELGPRLILIEGNHDRGAVRRSFPFVRDYQAGEFFFHHGHLNCEASKENRIEITGHLHPSIRFSDGAGTSLRVPALTQEVYKDGRETWRLPAFSPWAAGYPVKPACDTSEFRQWACGRERIWEIT